MGIRLRPLSVIAVALAAVAPLAGCSAKEAAENTPGAASSATSGGTSGNSPSNTGDSAAASPTTTQAPRIKKWIDLQAGDCLADVPPADPAVVEVTVVDCSQPHMAETFLRAPIPVDAALDGTANAQCQAGLAEYVGSTSTGTPYTVGYLIDSDQDRTGNNPLPSTVICLLQSGGGESLTGSARG